MTGRNQDKAKSYVHQMTIALAESIADSQAAIDGIKDSILKINKSLRKWHKFTNKSLKWAIVHIIESWNLDVLFIKV